MLKNFIPSTVIKSKHKSFKLIFATILLTFALFFSGNANNFVSAANWKQVTVYNYTGYTIYYFYMSTAGEGSWGPDLIGSGKTLPNGSSISFNYNADYAFYDMKIVFKDNVKREWTGDHQLKMKGVYKLTITPQNGNNNQFTVWYN